MNAINQLSVNDASPIEPANANILPAQVTKAGHAVIDRAALVAAVKALKGITEKRSTIPILSNVKMVSASSESLAIVATDLDMEVTVTIAGAIDDGFGVTLPVGILETLVAKAPKSEMVAIESHGEIKGKDGFDSIDKATIDFERARYDVHALPVGDFPILTESTATHSFELSTNEFLAMLDNVSGAISTEETRYYLNGVYLHWDESESKLIAVATDGYRLYVQKIAAPIGSHGMAGVIIPRKAVAYLRRTMKGKDAPEMVSISLSETRCSFEYGAIRLHTKLVDGSFPTYQRVIPSQNTKSAMMPVAIFKESLDAVNVISSEKGRAFRMTLENGACRLDINNPECGSASSAFACSFIDRASDELPALMIGFNSKYVDEILSDMESDEINMVFNDAGSPTLIFDSARDGWLGVLMPTRV